MGYNDRVEVHIVGGFADTKGYSENIVLNLLGRCKQLQTTKNHKQNTLIDILRDVISSKCSDRSMGG